MEYKMYDGKSQMQSVLWPSSHCSDSYHTVQNRWPDSNDSMTMCNTEDQLKTLWTRK